MDKIKIQEIFYGDCDIDDFKNLCCCCKKKIEINPEGYCNKYFIHTVDVYGIITLCSKCNQIYIEGNKLNIQKYKDKQLKYNINKYKGMLKKLEILKKNISRSKKECGLQIEGNGEITIEGNGEITNQ